MIAPEFDASTPPGEALAILCLALYAVFFGVLIIWNCAPMKGR